MPHLLAAARLLSWCVVLTFLLPSIEVASGQRAPGGDFSATNMTTVRRLTLNQKGEGYRGIWYAARVPREEVPLRYSGGMGTFCAKHQPFAIYRPEVNKTFFCFGGAPSRNDVHLLHMVAFYDHATGEVSRPTIVLDKQTSDARDNPVISIDKEGFIWLFSSSYARSRPSYIHRSTRPYDIDQFELVTPVRQTKGRERVIDNFSYAQVLYQPEVGVSCFFTRYDDPVIRTSYFMSSSDGVNWEHYLPIGAIDRGHYQIGAVTDGKVATMMNYHPLASGIDGRSNLYYIESIDRGKTWRSASGEPVTVPMSSPRNRALVLNTEEQNRLVFLKDLKFDDQGNPLLLYVTSHHHHHGPAGDPREWALSRFVDGQWRHSTITTCDHNYDYGSLDVHTKPWRLVATTDPGPQPGYTGGEIVFWTSDDQGQTWQKERPITIGSRVNQNYPRLAIDAHPDFLAFWTDGNPLRVSPSQLYFCNAKGEVFRLPPRMEQDRAKPERIDMTLDSTVAR